MKPEHGTCRETLREQAAMQGLDAEISVIPLLPLDGPYPPVPFRCPHKVTYWVQPTGEQIAQWVKDGTP